MKVFRITHGDFPDQFCICKTTREVESVVGTMILNDESAEEWGDWWQGEVTIKIDIVDMDKAEVDVLEPLEHFG